MNHLLHVLILVSIPMLSFSQKNKDGIYLEVEEERCTYQKLKLKNTKTTVCILDNPVITADDFQEISPIEVDNKKNIRSFSIKTTLTGSKKLATITMLQLGKNLAFVFDKEVLCLLKVDGVMMSGKITLTEHVSHASLQGVHQKIKESLAQ